MQLNRYYQPIGSGSNCCSHPCSSVVSPLSGPLSRICKQSRHLLCLAPRSTKEAVDTRYLGTSTKSPVLLEINGTAVTNLSGPRSPGPEQSNGNGISTATSAVDGASEVCKHQLVDVVYACRIGNVIYPWVRRLRRSRGQATLSCALQGIIHTDLVALQASRSERSCTCSCCPLVYTAPLHSPHPHRKPI